MTLSRDPVRNGPIYCSPACGCGCTYAKFLAATKAAKKLARAMGPGWEPCVWENLGWFWCVRAKSEGSNLAVHPRGYGNTSPTEYSAFLSDRDPGGRWVADDHKPHTAVAKVLAMAREEIASIQKMVAGVPPVRGAR